ncbi:MAG: hypothetical protein WBC33_04165 [Conexibacter sp.]
MDHQTLLVRRLVAAGGVVLVIILLVVLVKGCVDNRREQALKDYNREAKQLVEASRSGVSKPLFTALSGASGQEATQLQETLNQLRGVADEELQQAERLDVPGGMAEAQDDLELVLSLRRDGVEQIADLIQKAVGKSAAAAAAVDQIAGQMKAFSASDVIYSQRVAPLILRGLKDDGIAASYDGTAGEQVLPEADFLPNIGWISPTYVAGQLGATSGGSPSGTPAPGLHGHQLDAVSVGGVELVAGASNRIPANPPPTFMVTFTNGGENDETNVKVTVEITGAGAPIKAQAVVPNTTAGEQATANVQLGKAPPTSGPVTITVTVEQVAGEETLDNNTQEYTALFEP